VYLIKKTYGTPLKVNRRSTTLVSPSEREKRGKGKKNEKKEFPKKTKSLYD